MIILNQLKKTYNKGGKNQLTAVNNISLELPKSGMVALFGRSGCGKTTLLNLIGGLDRADSGEVIFGDKRITPSETDARNRSIGFIFQNYYLAETLTVEENVAASLRLCGLSDEKEIESRTKIALTAVGLEKYAKRLPGNLSGGQQQRVAIARAIVKNPEIILADEPTGNLDEANTVMIMNLLREISKNTLVVLVTHEAHLVDFYCDRVIEMLDGRIIGEKENEITGKYRSRSKNDVYLADMQKTENIGDRVSFSLYSDDSQIKLNLSIINVDGVFYIRNDSPDAKFRLLDSSAELRVHEGSYEEISEKKSDEVANALSEVISLPRINEGKTGRMYNVLSGIKSAWRKNFKKKRPLRVALVLTMLLLSVVFVLSCANNMTMIKTIDDIEDMYSDNLIYLSKENIPLSVLGKINQDSLLVYPSYEFNRDMNSLTATFNGGYSSSSDYYHGYRTSMYASSIFLPSSLASDYKLICGRSDPDNGEIVISKAVADDIIDSSKLSFIKKYEDLIGLGIGSRYQDGLRVVGIVDNNQKESFLSELDFCTYAKENAAIGAYSLADIDVDNPGIGEVYIHANNSSYKEGSKILINGKAFTVKGFFGKTPEYEDYGDYLIPETKDIYIEEDVDVDYWTSDVQIQVVMNDEDFKQTALLDGESTIMTYMYGQKDHYAIYPKDYDSMREYLLSQNISFKDREDMYEFYYEYQYIEETIVGNTVSMIIITLIIAACMFFIMRSSITSDVKEIGIYRAIGVSRKNIIFKYFIESNVLFFVTAFLGFAASAGMVIWANANSTATREIFYLPWYVALLAGGFLYFISIFFGTLSVSLLTKKTPAAIIAKYDI